MRTNAFRVLGLLADTPTKELRKRVNRLELLLEIGEPPSDMVLTDLRLTADRETLLNAIHLLEQGTTRLAEELGWIHSFPSAQLFPTPVSSTELVQLLTPVAEGKDTRAAVAAHNIAALVTVQANEWTNNSTKQKVALWRQAIQYWKRTYQDENFWLFLEDRAEQLNDDSIHAGYVQQLRRDLPTTVSTYLQSEITNAVSTNNSVVLRELASLLYEASDWIPSGRAQIDALAIEQIRRAEQTFKNETMKLDVPGFSDQPVELKRAALVGIKESTVRLIIETSTLLNQIGSTPVTLIKWGDSAANFLRQVSIMFFNFLDDSETALGLAKSARSYAKSASAMQPLDDDINLIQYRTYWDQAYALVQATKYSPALELLLKAKSFASQESQAQVEEAIQLCQRNRIFDDIDTSKKSPGLFTLNGIGATFYGSRDKDPATGSYVTTHWFVFAFLPIFPLGAYRVVDAGGNRYQIFGKVPLSKGPKRYGYAIACLIAVLFISAVVGGSLSTSDTGSSASRGNGSTTSAADPLDNQNPTAEDSALQAQNAELDRRQAELARRKQQLQFTSARIDVLGRDMDDVRAQHPNGLPEPLYSEYQQKLTLYKQLTTQYNADVETWNKDRDRYNADVKTYNDRVRSSGSQSR